MPDALVSILRAGIHLSWTTLRILYHCHVHFIDEMTDVGGGVVGLSNLPKATKQLQWLQTPVWPLPYTAPCYPINSQSLGLSHRRKGQWLVTMIFLLSQLLDCLRRSFGFCGDGVAWELSCSLGSSCDDLGHGWNFESELFLRDALIMTFIFFFWL